MTGPALLATVIGVLMLLGTLGAISRIVGALRTGKATDFSVDVCHGIMGVSMAGMLIPALDIVTVGPSLWIWLVLQSLVTAWFVVSTARELLRADAGGRLARLHHLPHVVLSGAMVYMLAVMAVMGGSGTGHAGSMSGMSGSMGMNQDAGGVPVPTLDLLLAAFLIGYTVLLVDRLPFVGRTAGSAVVIGEPRAPHHPAGHEATVFAPRWAAGLGILMASAMSYMLVMMFA